MRASDAVIHAGLGAVICAVSPCIAVAQGQAAQQAPSANAALAALLDRYCVRCHGERRPKAELSLHRLAARPFAAEADTWDRVLQALATRQMPPPKTKRQPSTEERAEAIASIRAGFAAMRRVPEWDVKEKSPEYANFVEHERLFDPRVTTPASTPSRLWKRSPFQFEDQLLRGLGLGKGRRGRVSPRLAKVKQPFAIEDKAGIRDFAAIQLADSRRSRRSYAMPRCSLTSISKASPTRSMCVRTARCP